ncbi:MAG: hypothetical protein K8U03_09275 [Planctomycetia bacterium]|nr:hypothetical protein [Planctomycetia bacterium]
MATFAENMVTKLEAVLLESAGLASTTIDGVTVALSDVEAKYEFWKAKVARENGRKPRVSTISLRRT